MTWSTSSLKLKQPKLILSSTLCYDTSSGINPIVMKLPVNIRDRWIGHALQYCDRQEVYFPPFNEFVNFVRIQSKLRSSPCFAFDTANVSPSAPAATRKSAQAKEQIVTRKTNVDQPPATDHKDGRCPIHNTRHQLADCKVFLQKVIPQRREILKKSGLCFRCLKRGHCRSDCKECCLRILR